MDAAVVEVGAEVVVGLLVAAVELGGAMVSTLDAGPSTGCWRGTGAVVGVGYGRAGAEQLCSVTKSGIIDNGGPTLTNAHSTAQLARIEAAAFRNLRSKLLN